MVCIIVPIYNEEEELHTRSDEFSKLSRHAELIFVDGKSTDKSAAIAALYGKVVSSERGRGRQMNAGAQEAAGDILFFLHADNTISPETISRIEEQTRRSEAVGGCLTQRIESERAIFRFIEWQGNRRARRTKIFYGDQGIFVRKDVFNQLGGFPEVPIFEDVLFTQKLKQAGKTIVLPDKIKVSARRWQKRGILRTTIMFNRFLIMFKLGCPLEKIKKQYEDLR